MRGSMRGHHGHHGMGEGSGCGCGGGPRSARDGGEEGGAVFGVRRPLRFLAHKLELDEAQAEELAKLLDELRIEHAQAAVDARRASATLADAVERDALDAAKVGEAAGARVKTAERLRDAVVRQVTRMHALLEPEQRRRLAFLVRSGALEL